MSQTLEKEIENALRLMVKRHGGLCLKWVCPGWAGVPDRIIIMPGGRIYFAETKRPKGGRLSSLQVWCHNKLRSFGFWVWVPKNKQDLITIETVITQERK